MKTTAVNLPHKIKKSTLDTILSFLDKSMVKAAILLFYILFVSLAVKCQNPITLASNNMSVSKNIEPNLKGGINSSNELALASTTTSMSNLDNFRKDTIKMLKNSMAKANLMISAYFHGVDDADDNYKAKKSGKGLILATTLIGSPVLGLIPAAVCSAISPKHKNLQVPNSTLVTNDPYMRGYKNEAKFIKKHNTWPSYVLSSITWICVVGFIVH